MDPSGQSLGIHRDWDTRDTSAFVANLFPKLFEYLDQLLPATRSQTNGSAKRQSPWVLLSKIRNNFEVAWPDPPTGADLILYRASTPSSKPSIANSHIWLGAYNIRLRYIRSCQLILISQLHERVFQTKLFVRGCPKRIALDTTKSCPANLLPTQTLKITMTMLLKRKIRLLRSVCRGAESTRTSDKNPGR